MTPFMAWALCLGLFVGAPSERSLLKELQQLDQKLTAANRRLRHIEQEQRQAQEKLAELSARVAATRVRKNEAAERFKKRIRALAKMPAGSRLLLLGGVRSFADYLATTQVLRWLAVHDRRIQQDYVAQAQLLQETEQALAQETQRRNAAKEKIRNEISTIATTRKERLALMQSIASQRELRAMVVQEKNVARKHLAGMLRRLGAEGITSQRLADNKNKLPWPTVGKVAAGFGQQIESGHGTVTSHNGLDIKAQPGTPVQATFHGTVVFAGWLQGYGQLVIVDHGDRYHTLMAHLARIDVAVGDRVTMGERVGAVGETGSLRGTVLYFEIRHNGVPVNPAHWLR